MNQGITRMSIQMIPSLKLLLDKKQSGKIQDLKLLPPLRFTNLHERDERTFSDNLTSLQKKQVEELEEMGGDAYVDHTMQI